MEKTLTPNQVDESKSGIIGTGESKLNNHHKFPLVFPEGFTVTREERGS